MEFANYFVIQHGGDEIHLPVGYRFQPSDQVLLVDYLLRRVLRQPLPANIMPEIDVYDYNPDQLPKNGEAWMDNKAYYFVPTQETNRDGSSCSPKFLTPNGYWFADADQVVVMDERRTLGFRKTLEFYEGHGQGEKTNWMMEEYKLYKDLEELRDQEIDDFVLCKVYEKKPVKMYNRRSRT